MHGGRIVGCIRATIRAIVGGGLVATSEVWLARWWQHWSARTATVLFACFLGLTAAVWFNSRAPLNADTAFADWILSARSTALTSTFKAITTLGSPPATEIFAGLAL